MLSVQLRGSIFLVFAAGLLALGICFPFSSHDWQRVLQIALISGALVYGLSTGSARACVDRPTAFGLLLIIAAGLLSSLLAHQPLWALIEVALMTGGATLAVAFCRVRRAGGQSLDRVLILLVMMLCLIKSVQYLYATLSAFTSGEAVLDTDLLLSGFSNKRFYGQFQTFTLPLLALPLLISRLGKPARAAAFALLCTWWLIAISGGTRGTWLGMGAAALLLLFSGASGRRWAGWQVVAACCGALLYWLVFRVLSEYLGIEVVNGAPDRLTTSLSGRGPIWTQAWNMIIERPWLGFGPMHFADITNDIATHPHQAILQWASEWGVPSMLCVLWLASRAGWAVLRSIHARRLSMASADLLRLCLFAALIGALTQSMVDGVIVMPNSQVWLALVAGWLMALHDWQSPQPTPLPGMRRLWTVAGALSVGLLIYVAIRDVPHLAENIRQYAASSKGHLQPRFWVQGVIALPKS